MSILRILPAVALIGLTAAASVERYNSKEVDNNLDYGDYEYDSYYLPEHTAYLNKDYECRTGSCNAEDFALIACEDLLDACGERMEPAKECDSVKMNCALLKMKRAKCLHECGRKEYQQFKALVQQLSDNVRYDNNQRKQFVQGSPSA